MVAEGRGRLVVLMPATIVIEKKRFVSKKDIILKKNIPKAQEMSRMSLGPLIWFSLSLSSDSSPSAIPLLLLLVLVVIVSIDGSGVCVGSDMATHCCSSLIVKKHY